MAKRVFEIARELSVQSKAILEKCQAEGIPSINNHMSSVSVGLEQTIREWFSDASAGGTAVETATKVDLTKVKAKAKPKAKARAKDDDADETVEQTPESSQEPVAEPAEPAEPTEIDAPEPPAAPKAPPAERVVQPAATSTEPVGDALESEDEADVEAPSETTVAPAATSETGEAVQDVGDEGAADEMSGARPNVPNRPDVVKPAGRKLETKTPAKLSGPKIVRVEEPDKLQQPRRRREQSDMMPVSRGPRGGAGAGFMPPPMPEEDAGRSSRRNKRRGGGAGGQSDAPRRGGGGGGGGAGGGGGGGGRRGAGRGDGGRSNWRPQDLIERDARLSRSEGFIRSRRHSQKRKDQSGAERPATPAQTGGEVRVTTPISIKELSSSTGVKAAEIVKKLFLKGVMANVNSGIEDDLAQEVMLDYNIDLVIEEQQTAEAVVVAEHEGREMIDERPRTPVVTILGHVDHGKTSLLDRIRHANVAAGEAGGITQATSAFRVNVDDAGEKMLTFLDTPGHEAFTEMRSRGANMTDIIVLVVAADDGVMPQTVESIAHAKAAEVPVIVALNKIDLPNATDSNIQKILGQLAEQGLNPTEWGGDTEVIRTSAQTGEGIQELLEMIDFQAQLMELKSDFKGAASGVVVEAKVEEGRGAVANLLIQQGSLSIGDVIVAGRAYGRVRDMIDHRGERLENAHPSWAVQISGLNEVPDAGDQFFVVSTLRKATEAAEQRRDLERERELGKPKMTLDTMFAAMQESDVKELRIILKADVQGSVDVIKNSVEDISTDDVKIRVLHAAVGGITESDVTLAAASNAVVLGFNVIPSAKARRMAEDKRCELRTYQVIYDIVDDMKKAAEGLLEPEIRQEILGHAEVRQVFRITKVGSVAGCYVTDGVIERNALIRVTRDDIVIENNRVLEQLKRFKDDAKEVRAGQECGMKIVGYDDIKDGDILECYRNVEVRRSL